MIGSTAAAPGARGRPRFLVTAPIPEPGLTLLRDAGTVHLPSTLPDADSLRQWCESGDVDIVVAQMHDRFDAALLDAAQIRGISNNAVGFNNVDLKAATTNAVLVANTPGVLTAATADVTLLLMLATARRAVEADAFVRAGRFVGWEPDLLLGTDVSGRTLGLAGFGRIGRAVARRALAFGMKVQFCPRPPGDRPVPESELGELAGRVHHIGWDDLVTTSDYLSLHVPLTDQTHHLVDTAVLGAMKSTATLINTSRGPVVDEAALVHALGRGEIAAAGLDVYENEPTLTPGLAQLPNTVLLPHIGSATRSVRANMARLCAQNAISMAMNQIPAHPVNPEAWKPGREDRPDRTRQLQGHPHRRPGC